MPRWRKLVDVHCKFRSQRSQRGVLVRIQFWALKRQIGLGWFVLFFRNLHLYREDLHPISQNQVSFIIRMENRFCLLFCIQTACFPLLNQSTKRLGIWMTVPSLNFNPGDRKPAKRISRLTNSDDRVLQQVLSYHILPVCQDSQNRKYHYLLTLSGSYP